MTVGENIMLGREPKKGPFIDQKKLHEQAQEILDEIGYQIDVNMICLLYTSIDQSWGRL